MRRRLRISWWAVTFACLCFSGMFCPNGRAAGTIIAGDGIVIVRGTDSIRADSEQAYAKNLTKRLSRWLRELGIDHRIIEDGDVTDETLRNVGFVVLGYNPYPPKKELAALDRFVNGGGRLAIFYSSEPRLARMLGLRLGQYKAAPRPGTWSTIEATDDAPAHFPERVLQDSANIRPVYPHGSGSKVVAVWRSADDRETGDPALVQTPFGMWMSHVLLDDGDTHSKKRLLLSMIGEYLPDVWERAAGEYLRSASTLDRYEDFEAAVSAIRRKVDRGVAVSAVNIALARARGAYKELLEYRKKGKYAEVVARSSGLRDLLMEAYGRAQDPRFPEFRGVWDHTGRGLVPGDWAYTARTLYENGMTDIFPNMLWVGSAHFPSSIVSGSDTYRLFGDQVRQCLEACRKYGIRVHVWKVCWRVESAPDELVKRFTAEGRLQVTDGGETIKWLCPSHPANRELEIETLRELVSTYPVDGVHLDYIRYPSSHTCYCATCRKQFEAAWGRKIDRWPQAVRQGSLARIYRRWRVEQITSFVREVKRAVVRANPDVSVSAAVYGKYPSCRDSVGQDWPIWLAKGDVDFVVPMDYTEDISDFTALVHSQMSLPDAGRKVFPGIGVSSSNSSLDAVDVINQIVQARKAGAGGFVLFDLNRRMATEIFPVLRYGVTAGD